MEWSAACAQPVSEVCSALSGGQDSYFSRACPARGHRLDIPGEDINALESTTERNPLVISIVTDTFKSKRIIF